MGLFDFFKSPKPETPTKSSTALGGATAALDTYLPVIVVNNSADGKRTSIYGKEFLLELPFRWEQVPNEASLEFHNRPLSEQLIATARRTRENLTADERRLLVSKIIEVHQNALQKAATGEVRLSPPEQVHNGSESEGRFYAKGPAMKMAFGVRYIPNRVHTFSLYRYTDQDFGMPFGQYAGAILDLLKIKPS